MTSNRITSEEFLRFNEQLLALTRARIPLDRGLREMAAEIKNERLRNYTGQIAHRLEQGMQLSEAIQPVSPAATEYYLTLLKAGEQAGSLVEVLHHIVTESRRRIDHRPWGGLRATGSWRFAGPATTLTRSGGSRKRAHAGPVAGLTPRRYPRTFPVSVRGGWKA